jgi:hypothetical protein
MQVRVDQLKKGGSPCGCGRSPTGFCIGWHGLEEGEYREKLAEWQLKESQENLDTVKSLQGKQDGSV